MKTLQKFIKKYDLILLSETLTHSKQNTNLEINEYIAYHLFGNKSHGTKKGRFSGVLSVYIFAHIHIYENLVCFDTGLQL